MGNRIGKYIKKEKVILWAKERVFVTTLINYLKTKDIYQKLSYEKIKCTTSIVEVAGCDILFLVSPVQYLSTNLPNLKNY